MKEGKRRGAREEGERKGGGIEEEVVGREFY